MFTQTITLLLILSLQEGSQQFPVEMVKTLLDRSDLTKKKQELVAVCLNTAIKE